VGLTGLQVASYTVPLTERLCSTWKVNAMMTCLRDEAGTPLAEDDDEDELGIAGDDVPDRITYCDDSGWLATVLGGQRQVLPILR